MICPDVFNELKIERIGGKRERRKTITAKDKRTRTWGEKGD